MSPITLITFAIVASFVASGLTQSVGPGQPCNVEGSRTPADDGCNSCVCMSGSYACTKIGCPAKECTDGTVMKRDCNTCTCINGYFACTEMYCGTSTDGTITGEFDCVPGTRMKTSCNSCSCSEKGHLICTMRACLDDVLHECIEGQVKNQKCNSCSCVGGQWQCTLAICNPFIFVAEK